MVWPNTSMRAAHAPHLLFQPGLCNGCPPLNHVAQPAGAAALMSMEAQMSAGILAAAPGPGAANG
jgi:hypothetical protein